MASPPKSSVSPTRQAATVHQKLSSVLGTGSSSSSGGSKPFMKSKSQTTTTLFPSFRFSSESEEIQEVISGGGGEDGGGGSDVDGETSDISEPIPTSSSGKSGGDISPLKEYILKHKWANKWDKRSLSLDLDLKGKLFTALEDKRKSFVSQFLNEEEEEINLSEPLTPLTSSCSIPEQLVGGSNSSSNAMEGSCGLSADYYQDSEDLSVSSDTVLVRNNGSRKILSKLNFEEENCPDYFDYDEYDVVEEEAMRHQKRTVTIPDLDLDPSDLKNLVVEEIGVDCCDDNSGMVGDKGHLALLRDFVLPPDSLQERFEGLPTLYNPPAIVLGLRKFPIPEVASSASGGVDGAAGPSADGSSSEEDVGLYRQRDRSEYTLKGLIRNILLDVVYHPLVKYWIGLLAVVITVEFSTWIAHLIWFVLGLGVAVIGSRGLWRQDQYEQEEEGGSPTSVTNVPSGFSLHSAVSGRSGISAAETASMKRRRSSGFNTSFVGSGLQWKSQGWLLTLVGADPKKSPYPMYDPFKNHLRDSKPVFARLNGPYLTLSFPHPKHKIPKRRLWSDPVINSEHIFIRHQHFDLTGAKVEIVPEGLARKRVWCKKYPIAVTLAVNDKFCGELTGGVEMVGVGTGGTGTNGGRDSPTGEPQPQANDSSLDPPAGKVSFSKDEKGDGKVQVGSNPPAEKPKGEVFKEEGGCAGKVIYLFCRCDREKDDWFRRLVSATKVKLKGEDEPSPTYNYAHFYTYMMKACPSMMVAPRLLTPPNTSPRLTPTNDLLFESVSMHHLSHGMDMGTTTNTSSPSSMKSSPMMESFNFNPGEVMNPSFLNALIGRLFYDFLQSDRWNDKVRKMIDRKLFFIRKPVMVQSLKVKSLEFGDSLPVINHASTPVLDSQGLWVDMDIGFQGNITITLEAFINLMRMGSTGLEERLQERVTFDLKRSAVEAGSPRSRSPNRTSPNSNHAMFDSEADDSGESSESDDDVDLEETESKSKSDKEKGKAEPSASKSNANIPSGGRGKLLRYADSFAKSSMMRNKHVQKMVSNIAATPILLTVEIVRVVGSVAVNIPPVPTDRVWLGFRSNLTIDINVRPKVGQRMISLSQITEWIKKKILLEFQRVMVCPNMEDITVPLMEFKLPE